MLASGETLQPGWFLESGNGTYRVVMQGDGNLVLYHGGTALWSSRTNGDGGASATMQGDGNLVVYYDGVAKWNSGTAGFSGARLLLQNDSNLVVYQGSHPLWDWSAGYLGNKMTAGITLTPGEELFSPDHTYRVVMQGDGNLVLYHGGTALWSSRTNGDGGASATMQGDGNLVVYYDGVAKWNSGTAGFSGARLLLQNDSNLVVYQGSHPLWDWSAGYLGNKMTAGITLTPGEELFSPDHTYRVVMQGDGNLVLYHGGTALWSSRTNGDGGASATMQGDGNLVVYYDGVAKWNSGTAGFPRSFLDLQNDDNLVIYHGGTAIWDWESGKLSGSGKTGELILREAEKWEGRPYCWDGGNESGPTLGEPDPEEGPDHGLFCGIDGYDHSNTPGFDCTGLTIYAVYQATKDVLTHNAFQVREAIAHYHPQVIYHESELQPGDIVYFHGSLEDFVHAGVYVGGGSFVSAVTEGIGVTTETMAWEGGFVGALRF